MKKFLIAWPLLLPVLLQAQLNVINSGAFIKVGTGATIRVENGGIRNENSGLIENEGEVYLDANYNQNTGANYLGGAASWLTFEGVANQQLLGDALVTIARLRVDNANELQLQQNLAVTTTLDLSNNGNVRLNTFDLLADNASLLNYDDTHHIITNSTGSLRQSLAAGDIKEFPVGNSLYNPATLQSNAGATDLFNVRVEDLANVNGTAGPAYTNDAVARTWHITEGFPGGNNLNLTVEWSAVSELAGFDRPQSGLAYWTGSQWSLISCSPAVPVATRWSQTRLGQTSFSPFAVLNAGPVPTIIATPSSLCSGSTVSLSATGGTSYAWSTGAVGQTITDNPLVTTSYTVTATNAGGCTATTSATVTVNPLPAAPVVTGTSICAGNTASLTATGSGGTLAWFDAAFITPLALGGAYTTPILNQTTTFYVRETDANGCQATSPVTVNVNPLPNNPTVNSPVSACNGSAITLSATGSGTGDLRFHDNTLAVIGTVSMGGTATQSFSAGTLPVGNYAFYVTEFNGTCSSAPVAIGVQVNALPTISTSPDTAICAGQSVQLFGMATGSSSSGNILFVSDNADVTEIPAVLTTAGYTVTIVTSDYVGGNNPTLQGSLTGYDAIYWHAIGAGGFGEAHNAATFTNLSAYVNAGGAVFVTGYDVIASPFDPELINFLGGTSSNDVPPNGGTSTLLGPPSSLTSGVFNTVGLLLNSPGDHDELTGLQPGTQGVCAANTGFQWSVRTLGAGEAAWVSSPQFGGAAFPAWQTLGSGYHEALLNFAFAHANATSAGPYAFSWSNGLQNGLAFTPTATNTYTVTGTDLSTGCSNTATVTVTVNPLPAAPVVAPVAICSGQTANLTASSSGGTTQWFDAAFVAPLATGTAYTTPALTQSMVYYVIETNGFGCSSPIGSAVVTVNPLPANPTVASPASACEGDALTLNATGSGTGDLRFHDNTLAVIGTATMGGVPSQSFNAGILALGSYTFYVTEFDGTCSSAPVAIAASVLANPAAPLGTGATVCAGNTATLSANTTVEWYSDAALTQLLTTASTYTTPVLSTSTDYYIRALSANGCSSSSVTVTATVNPNPAAPTAAPTAICAGQTASLTATGAGGTINWFDASLSAPIATGTAYTTPALTQSTTYFLTETDANGCVSPLASVLVTVNPVPSNPTVASPASACEGDALTLNATGSGTGDLRFHDNSLAVIGTATMGGVPSQSFNAGILALGSYTFYVTEFDGTCSSAPVAIAASVLANPAAPLGTGATVCAGNTATLSANTTVEWYSDAALTQLLTTASTYTTPVLSTSTDYYIRALSANGCSSPTVTVTATVNPNPTAPTAAPTAICAGQTASLTATGAGGTINWFDASLSAPIATGTAYTTPALTQSTTYFLTETDANGCVSPLASVLVTVNPVPSNPTVASPASACEGDALTLNATGSGTGDLRFHDNSLAVIGTATMGGVPSQSFNAGILALGSYTFYVTEFDGTCSSAPVAIAASVLANPAAPLGTGATVCAGNTATLSANTTVEWYSDAALTQLLTTASTYTTPVLSTSTDYYIRALSANGCSSSSVTVTATVNPNPAAPTAAPTAICAGQTASLTATGAGGTINWFDASLSAPIATGTAYTTPALTQSTTYFLTETDANGCVSPLASVLVTVNPVPSNPTVASPASACEGDALTLNATGSGTGDLRFHDNTLAVIGTATMGGVPSQSFNAGILALGSYTFYVTEFDGTCSSAPVAIAASVLANPAAPLGTGATVCAGNTATLSANTTVEWYSDAALTQLLTTASTYTTPVLSTSTDYYIRALSANGCSSSSVTVTATVNPNPTAPTAAPTAICAGQTASLTATGAGGTINWFDASLSAPIATGTAYTTPALTQSTTYFLTETDANGCVSPLASVLVTVNPVPSNPTVASPASACEGDALTLNATGSGTGDLRFHDNTLAVIGTATMGGVPNQNFNAGILALGSYTFYVTEFDGTCSSAPVAIAASVLANPTAPVGTGATVCAGNTATLSANTTVEWYSDAALTQLLTTASTYTTPVLSTSTDYYIRALSANGCSSSSVTVSATVLNNPVPPEAVNAVICEGQTATLGVIGAGPIFEWSNDPSMVPLLASGNALVTPQLGQTTIYYVVEVNAAGCRSIAVPVTATVNLNPPTPTIVSPVLVCQGQDAILSATGSGNVQNNLVFYNASMVSQGSVSMATLATQNFNAGILALGSYVFYVTENDTLCQSTPVAIRVDVNALPAAPMVTGTTTICAGESTTLQASTAANWYADAALTSTLATGNSFFSSPSLSSNTTYYTLVLDANGCASPVTQTLITVNAAPAIPSVSNDTVCQGNSATLSATGSGGTLQWYAAGMQPLNMGNTLTLAVMNQNTFYFVQETGTNGCLSPLASAQVVVLPRLTPPSVAPVLTCDGQDVILAATGSGTGELVFYNTLNTELGRTTMSTALPSGNLNIGVLPVGNYAYRVAEAQGNCFSDQVGIAVEVRALPAAPTLFNDGPACEGEDVFVQASSVNGALYSWSGPNGFVSGSQTFSLLEVGTAQAGAYTLTIFANGCNALPVSTSVVVNARPVITAVNNNGPLCEGETLNLSATAAAGLGYEWTGPNGFSSNSAAPSLANVTENNNQGFYGLVLTDPATGCRSIMSSTLVMINALPQAGFILNPGAVCEGDSLVLQAQSVFGATYAWSGPNGYSSTQRNALISNMSADQVGTYTLTITANACATTLSTDVAIRQAQLTSIHPDTTIELGSSLQLYATGGILYQWSPPEFLSDVSSATPTMVPTRTGEFNYSVRIIDLFGCSNTGEVRVTVVPSLAVLIPDLFTPNGDGFNDTWMLDFLQPLSGYEIRIFSRGGLEVFTSKNYANDWEGKHYKSGKILPDGTYYYLITLADGTEFRGPVTIKR